MKIHVIVIDEDGDISGTAGNILETFPFLSVASNAKASDGTSNYYKDVSEDCVLNGYTLVTSMQMVTLIHSTTFVGANWGSSASTSGEDFKTDNKTIHLLKAHGHSPLV